MTPEEERLIAEVLSAGRRAGRNVSTRKPVAPKKVRIWIRRRNVLRMPRVSRVA